MLKSLKAPCLYLGPASRDRRLINLAQHSCSPNMGYTIVYLKHKHKAFLGVAANVNVNVVLRRRRIYDSQHTDSKQTVRNGLHMILFTTRINLMKPIDYFDRWTLTDLRNINNAGF